MRDSKLLGSIREAIEAAGLKDGDTISFHHSFREGDLAVGQVMEAIRSLGIKGLRFAPSAVVNLANFSLADCVRDGTINRVEASGIRGELGDGLLDGSIVLPQPAILRPHGARPRAMEARELTVDVAFIVASAAGQLHRTDWSQPLRQPGLLLCGRPVGQKGGDYYRHTGALPLLPGQYRPAVCGLCGGGGANR